MAATTGAILDRVGACEMRYETTVIMSSLSSPNSFQPSQPSSPGADSPGTNAVAPKAPRLLDQVRERVRYLHYSIRTKEAYVHWVRAFVRFHGLRHPNWMGGEQVQAFLTWLSVERHVSASKLYTTSFLRLADATTLINQQLSVRRYGKNFLLRA